MEERNQQLIKEIIEIFKSHSSYSLNEALVAAIFVLVWHKCSALAHCPEALKIIPPEQIEDADLVELVKNAAQEMTGDPLGFGSSVEWMLTKSFDAKTFKIALARVQDFAKRGLLDDFDPTDAILVINHEAAKHSDLCDLLLGLAGDIDNKSVYLPWDGTAQLTGRTLKAGGHAHVEIPHSGPLPELIASNFGKHDLYPCISDPVVDPLYVTAGELQRFDFTVTSPPVGMKVGKEAQDKDLFGRFVGKTNSYTTLAIQHVLAQTQGIAVIATGTNITFGSGAEHQLREYLLENKLLKAVIALPPGLLSSTSIPLTILVLDTVNQHNTVRFIDANNDFFRTQATRSKVQMKNLDVLIDLAHHGVDGDFVKNVSVTEILHNDAQLQVNRYVLDQRDRAVAEKLANQQLVRLGDLVTFIRPNPVWIVDDGISATELSATDLPEFGYITTASKPVHLERGNKKTAELFLRPLDIVLTHKGSIGKVGLVGHQVPPPETGGWLPSQSAVILRSNGQLDNRALFVILRSGLGQHLVQKLTSGGTLPFIKLKDLGGLAIPVPTAEDAAKLAATLDEETTITEQIRNLQQQIVNLTPDYLRLPTIDEE